jgi:hypothetical protein
MQALTASTLHFGAASITDGINYGYLQYLMAVDSPYAREFEGVIGPSPFGKGLEAWMQRAPEFKMDKVDTPLQVVTTRQRTLEMWEPYVALRYQKKPVDLVVLNSDEHVYTNPATRLVSQRGTVEWFRFWLKGEEDPDPTKAEQYARWRELRKLQEASQKKTDAAAVAH